MKTLGNVIWFLLGGFELGLAWWISGLLCYISIIGIPWGKACFTIGTFAFFPFGQRSASRELIYGFEDIGTGALGFIGNVIWFVFAGLWLALGHLTAAIACFVTIIGIPFGVQHLKLAKLAIAPIGKTLVPIL